MKIMNRMDEWADQNPNIAFAMLVVVGATLIACLMVL
jgi:hypothetical protein